jgi:prepilin-type N-terminal cleavage/methylation domain-containing protein
MRLFGRIEFYVFNQESLKMMLYDVKSDERGFTLVELAIVMIIIGLLISGVLKGQELIKNAQVASTITQVKGYNGAVSTFDDMYSGVPGDLRNAGNRIPDCTVANGCIFAGGAANLGNRRIDVLPDVAPATESVAFWVQMSQANLISGIRSDGGNLFDERLPSAKIGGGFHIGFSRTGQTGHFGQVDGATQLRSGHYLALNNNAGAAISALSATLSPNVAQRLDTKLDDGNGESGSVRAFSGDESCSTGGVYNETESDGRCGLYIRVME